MSTTTSSFNLINVGTSPNDGTGDDLRTAFVKVNNNFSNITTYGQNVGNLIVSGFANVAGNLNIYGAIHVLGNITYSQSSITSYTTLNISDPQDSTSTTTGAIVVSGGLGIGKNLTVGGNVTVNALAVNAGFSGTITTISQPNITTLGNLTALSVAGETSLIGVVYANAAINSNSATTGSMVVNGGLGVTGNLWLTGGIGVGSSLGTNGQMLVSTGTSIAWSNIAKPDTIIFGTTSVVTSTNYANISVSGNSNIVSVSTTRTLVTGSASTSTSTGALVVSGGLGVSGNINAGNVITTQLTGTLLTAAQPNVTSIGTLNGLAVTGNISASTGIVTADQFSATNNGNGTNFRVGDDAWIGDINITNTLRIAGVQDSTQGYIVFGNTNTTTYIGRSGSGAITVTGAFGVSGNINAGNVITTQLTGTLLTAAQPNVTSVGTLTGLTVSGTTTPNANASINLGSTSAYWGSIYASSIYATNHYGTIQTAAQPNVTSVGTLTGLTVSGTTTPNANASINLGSTSNYWDNIYGATIYATNHYGTLQTAAQPNVTSVGTLTGLTVSGAVTPNANASVNLGSTSAYWGSIYASSIYATNHYGTIQTAAQPNVTSVGTLTGLTVSGAVTPNANASVNLGSTSAYWGSIYASSIYATNHYGTIQTAAQPNITSVGTLTGLSVGGTITVTSNVTAIANGATDGFGNIGASGQGFNTVFAKATSAQYADLAEKYLADAEYEPGTVVTVGGTFEVTASKLGDRAIGVVSTAPAYMMNSELENGTYIALKGRVPTKVSGIISKGDRLIAGNTGVALSATSVSNNVFAIALENKLSGGIGFIEAIII